MAELGKIILHDIEQALSRDDSFRHNLTAFEAGYEFRLTLEVVPSPGEPIQQQSTILSGGLTTVTQIGGEMVSAVPLGAPRQKIELSFGRKHSAITEPPDLLRKRAGLYIPTPQVEPATGLIVDIPNEEMVREKLAAQQLDTRSEAIRERDELMKGKTPMRFEARPAEELAQDVVEDQVSDMRPDIMRADRVDTILPPEHIVVDE
jgi:hypothetical protein